MTAADLCSLVASTMNSSRLGNGVIFAYGTQPDDAILVPPPTRITVLVTNGDRKHWFDITVREVDPSTDPAGLLYDPEILATLTRRARNQPRE